MTSSWPLVPGPHADADADVEAQVDAVRQIISNSPMVDEVLDRLLCIDLPAWYLGAGAITQTVWNALHHFEPGYGIKDYDVVYFDDADLSADAERAMSDRVRAALSDLGVVADVKNQARVHLWYEQRFGRACPVYRSSEAAIATWPTTATAVGVRRTPSGDIVCAPYGLRDLVALVVRPNRTLIDERIYVEKVRRWRRMWPLLTIIEW